MLHFANGRRFRYVKIAKTNLSTPWGGIYQVEFHTIEVYPGSLGLPSGLTREGISTSF